VPGFEDLGSEGMGFDRLRKFGPMFPRESQPQNHQFLLFICIKNNHFSTGVGGTIGEVRTGPWEGAWAWRAWRVLGFKDLGLEGLEGARLRGFGPGGLGGCQASRILGLEGVGLRGLGVGLHGSQLGLRVFEFGLRDFAAGHC